MALRANHLGAAVLALVSFGWTHELAAQDAAIAPFSGRGNAAVRRIVSQELDEQLELTGREETDRAARSAGVSGLEADGVSDLAAELGVDLVIQGETSGPRRRITVTLVIRAADGAELARGEPRYAAGRVARRRFGAAIESLLEEARAALAERAARAEQNALQQEPVEQAEPESASPAAAAAPEDGLALFSATLGLVVRNRDMLVTLMGGGGSRGYASGAYTEGALRIEARPFRDEAHLGRGLFLNGTFAHSIGLASLDDLGAPVDGTNFLRFSFNAGWLVPIDDVEIGLGVGFTYDGYHLAANTVLPGAEYLAIRPGLRARFRFEGEALVLDVEAAYRGVVGVGALAAAFGEGASAHGLDVGASLGGNLMSVADGVGFTYAVRFDWVYYLLAFAGPASDAPAQDGTESSVRLSLLVGYSF